MDFGSVADDQLHGAAVALSRQVGLGLTGTLDAGGASVVGEADVGQQAAGDHVAFDEAAVDEDVGMLLRGHQ